MTIDDDVDDNGDRPQNPQITSKIKLPQEEHCAPNVQEASEHNTLKPAKLDHLDDDNDDDEDGADDDDDDDDDNHHVHLSLPGLHHLFLLLPLFHLVAKYIIVSSSDDECFSKK